MTDDLKRTNGGRFAPGNSGGPGRRPRSTPLHRAITDERAEQLWAERDELARDEKADPERRDKAAEFILRNKTGSPPVAAPDVPAVPWGRIREIGDVRRGMEAVFALHEAGEIDGTGLDFLLRILERAAKLLETVDIAPVVAQLMEQMREWQQAQQRRDGTLVGRG